MTTQNEAYLAEVAARTDAHDIAFVKALSAQADAFFGFDKLKAVVEDLEYLSIRTHITGSPINTWRKRAATATALAKGGMTAEDIIDEGIEAVLKVDPYSNPEPAAELVATIAATYGVKGEQIRTIPTITNRILEVLR